MTMTLQRRLVHALVWVIAFLSQNNVSAVSSNGDHRRLQFPGDSSNPPAGLPTFDNTLDTSAPVVVPGVPGPVPTLGGAVPTLGAVPTSANGTLGSEVPAPGNLVGFNPANQPTNDTLSTAPVSDSFGTAAPVDNLFGGTEAPVDGSLSGSSSPVSPPTLGATNNVTAPSLSPANDTLGGFSFPPSLPTLAAPVAPDTNAPVAPSIVSPKTFAPQSGFPAPKSMEPSVNLFAPITSAPVTPAPFAKSTKPHWTFFPTHAPIHAPTSQPVTYVSKEDDILNKDKDDQEDGWFHKGEDVEELPHDKNVIIVMGVLMGIMLLLMVATAHQMMNNPDGICAGICRLAVTCTCFILKTLCLPCRMICGGGSSAQQHARMGMTEGTAYSHDLELS